MSRDREMRRVMPGSAFEQGESERENCPSGTFSGYWPSGTALGEMTASATAFILNRRSIAAL